MEVTITTHIPAKNNTAAECHLNCFIDIYCELADKYKSKWSLECLLTDPQGKIIVPADSVCAEQTSGDAGRLRKQAIDESLRWGEPSLLLNAHGEAVFAVPITCNASVIGGLVVENVRMSSDSEPPRSHSTQDIRLAAIDLLSMAEEADLTNRSLLYIHRTEAKRESQRAEAIHELKGINYQSVRDIYLNEEPELIASIKKGDRPKAREILNRVLVGIYYLGRNRPNLLKSFILELVVTMSRSAVEAGGDPSVLLGANYSSVSELAAIDTEEELCAWLVAMLERMLDAIGSNRDYPNSVLLAAAIKYMRDHIKEEITRDDVADVACLSPSHFSRVIKQTFGYSFTDILTQIRVDKAKELLVTTDLSLLQISLDCGFNDQSYFTKVFQKHTGTTPGDYRKVRKPSIKPPDHIQSNKPV